VRIAFYWGLMAGVAAYGAFHAIAGETLTALLCVGFIYLLWKKEADE